MQRALYRSLKIFTFEGSNNREESKDDNSNYTNMNIFVKYFNNCVILTKLIKKANYFNIINIISSILIKNSKYSHFKLISYE